MVTVMLVSERLLWREVTVVELVEERLLCVCSLDVL